ncbi:MAG: lipoprotein LpqH [Mycobacterium sp.]|nr:lipoprotein LpqH [Mycobacterium sp.]
MKRSAVVLAAATAWVIGAPLAHAASATVTLNGQNIPVNGQVSCATTEAGFTLEMGHDAGSAWVEIGNSPSYSHQPTAVTRVQINDLSDATYEWQPSQQLTNGNAHYQGPSDPNAHSAGSYKITGQIPLIFVPSYPAPGAPPPIGGSIPSPSLLPFEIDATCP